MKRGPLSIKAKNDKKLSQKLLINKLLGYSRFIKS
jgi:hypothetical protein